MATKYANSVNTKVLKQFVEGSAIVDRPQCRNTHIEAAMAVMLLNEMLRIAGTVGQVD